MQKARRRPFGLRPLVNERFQGLFHSPVRGASHLSLTVLVHYRSSRIFSLAAWSPQIQTGFHVSRPTQVVIATKQTCLYGSVTLYGPTFQTVPVHLLHLLDYSYNPDDAVTTSV